MTLEDSAPPQATPAGLAGGVRRWGASGVQASLYCHAGFLILDTFPFEAEVHKMWALGFWGSLRPFLEYTGCENSPYNTKMLLAFSIVLTLVEKPGWVKLLMSA